MMTARAWLQRTHLLRSSIVAIVLVATVGGTALAASPFGLVAKKKCNQTCRETKLFNSLYAARIAKARVAFATTAGNATSAGSAGSAATAGTLTGMIGGAQVSGPVASASTAMNATNATDAANVTGTVNGAQVAGTVANATNASSAANVDGHTFTQIDASAGSGGGVTLVKDFGGLTLECVGPAGTEGTVTLAVVNSSQTSGSFGASEVDGAGTAHFDEGSVLPAVGSTPVTTEFTFPIHSGAQVNFSFKQSSGSTTDVVSGTFTMTIDNGCTAFGSADASAAAG
jgi:hypothetical protein